MWLTNTNIFLIQWVLSSLFKKITFGCAGPWLLPVGFSLIVASMGYSLLQSAGARQVGFCDWSTRAQKLCFAGLVAVWHVESSQTRDWTRVPCIGRQILTHCITQELLFSLSWWCSHLMHSSFHLWSSPVYLYIYLPVFLVSLKKPLLMKL